MKKIVLIMTMTAFALAGCTDERVPAPELESEGTEKIIEENVIVEKIEIDPIRVDDVEKVDVETDGVMPIVDLQFDEDGSDVYDEVKTVTMYLKNGGELTEPKDAFCARFGVEDVLWDVNDKSLWCVVESNKDWTVLRNFFTLEKQA